MYQVLILLVFYLQLSNPVQYTNGSRNGLIGSGGSSCYGNPVILHLLLQCVYAVSRESGIGLEVCCRGVEGASIGEGGGSCCVSPSSNLPSFSDCNDSMEVNIQR